MILGSTADGVLRATHVPTFVIRRSASRVPVALAPKSDPEPRASFGCVLVALDPSEAAEAALAFALDFATAKRSRLKFCTVVQVGDFVRSAAMYGYDPTDPIEDMRATAATHLDATLAAARARGLEADSTVVDGHPSHALLDAAAACGADLIAIGTHGRRGLDRLLFGSVAESVVARSPVPVVVIHAPARA